MSLTPQHADPPFVAVYECQSSAVLGVALEQFPQIVSIQALTRIQAVSRPGEISDGIIANFRNCEAFDAAQAPLLQVLQKGDPAAQLVWSGFEFQSQTAPVAEPPWYQSFTAKWAIFATFVGALGVIDSARNHWLEFFEPAQVIDMSPRDSIDVLAGDPWKLEFHVKNAARGIPCAVWIDRVQMRRGERVGEIQTPQQRYPGVRSGERETITVESELFPREFIDSVGNRPGIYECEATGRAWGGYLTWMQKFHIPRKLRIWPASGHGAPQISSLLGPSQTVQMRVPIYVGKSFPRGQDCSIVMEGIEITALRASHTPAAAPELIYNERGSIPLAVANWKTTPTGPFEEYTVTLVLEADQLLSQKQWEERIARSAFKFRSNER